MKNALHLLYLIPILIIFNSCTSNEDPSAWFTFSPDNDFSSPSVINMESWLDAPAGKHGFVQMKGKELAFEDGTPVKFWGVNICSNKPFIENEEADKFIDMLEFMGVNSVRFHKFTWNATHPEYSTIPDSIKFSRMDYFQSKLRERGLYYGWSHIYGHRVKPGDSSKLLAYEEIANLEYPWQHLSGSTSSLVNFAPDLQELNIELTVNMLNRKNPFTGLRYADDPALSFIEFQNEDNIFWGAMERALEQAPSYRALLCRQFSQWLKTKYENDQYLKNAWGNALPDGESIAKLNIYPSPNHGLFSSGYEKSLETGDKISMDLLDKMQFLYEKQMEFYDRFKKAVRDTGYKGTIVGSCWQAGSGISHIYNLHADYSAGIIDRHNYFGGGKGGHRLDTGFVRNTAMVSHPGSGLLSAGMQQVVDRPFAFSEWMSLIPNQWTAESSPIIATYGMGLQGWDASYSFAVDEPGYTSTIQSPHGVYNATSPTQMGLYPALSAMIYRGDISEAEVLITRNVHIPSLAEGKLGFVDKVKQGYDDKVFSGSVRPELLAAGRIPIAFTETHEETTLFPLDQLENSSEKVISSTTGELMWDFSEKGFITIDTDGTKGIIGFASGQEFDLGGWKLSVENEFSVIYLTSLDREKGLNETNRILITALGRAKNSGMEYSEDESYLLNKGEAPVQMEAIIFKLKSGRQDVPLVKPLDHMGRPTGEEITLENNEINIDGRMHKTIYYLLEYK